MQHRAMVDEHAHAFHAASTDQAVTALGMGMRCRTGPRALVRASVPAVIQEIKSQSANCGIKVSVAGGAQRMREPVYNTVAEALVEGKGATVLEASSVGFNCMFNALANGLELLGQDDFAQYLRGDMGGECMGVWTLCWADVGAV